MAEGNTYRICIEQVSEQAVEKTTDKSLEEVETDYEWYCEWGNEKPTCWWAGCAFDMRGLWVIMEP